VTAPFRDPRPSGDELDVWPTLAELNPETIAAYMAQARRMRIDAIREIFAAAFVACRKILRS
jgi:hypothetical protein